jgi:hypothetical protein
MCLELALLRVFRYAGRSACDPRPIISCSRQWSLWYHSTGLDIETILIGLLAQLDTNLVLPQHSPVLRTLTVSSVGRATAHSLASLAAMPLLGCVSSLHAKLGHTWISLILLAQSALMAPELCIMLELFFVHIA